MKKLKLIGCLVALAAIVGVNAWNAGASLKSSDLDLSNVETIAEAEHGGYNSGWDLFKYGLTKDEKEQKVDCAHRTVIDLHYNSEASLSAKGITITYKLDLGGYKSEVSFTLKRTVCVDGGNINCDPSGCPSF